VARNGRRLAFPAPGRRSPGQSQRGAYAVEFSVVFAIFFLVFYGLLTYGLIFTAQQSVSLAAEEGARAALRWQGAADAWQARADKARTVAQTQADWLARMGGAGNVPVTVCGKSAAGNPVRSGPGPCDADALQAGQMEVVVSYLYGTAPLIPSLLGSLRVAVPDRLVGRARVCLGIATAAGQECGSIAAAPT